MLKKIYWYRITVTDLTETEHTFMYPSTYRYWGVNEIMEALEDLDCDGYPATVEYAGWSMIDIDKDAGYWFYKMGGMEA